ncbi:hydantoinase/oxoprolinase N-terminal domain-containing protein [Ketogulonicigenium vulgare]|uniref:Hydantoinase beta subunit-like protein n=1 Tax=Ketogulonicigenium vulgare (strain WSH-001) TaxID=759362 RepID=F9YBU4_KETVW|nr:hydantoinase/oxoprolinase family protein [Ketogulonicigenium vulgare]AEM42846.1 Hydantoinase beta subunit-like protein [Ketogulonicigenium vulgare WSH-001]ALJ82726.1 hydantoinase [Ketogulonicigenium vulgare]
MKRIGIDVGGTNTDAVLITGERVLSFIKQPTTADVMTGVVNAIKAVMAADPEPHIAIDAVMIGTTHFTNAVVERARLERAAAVRIAMPASASLPPMVDWPQDLFDAVAPLRFMVEGGHEYDGRPLVPFNREQMFDAAYQIRDAGITSVGITGLFSPLTAEGEAEAAAVIRTVIPDARITLSHTLGRIGLLERENVTMLNAALQGLGASTVDAFRKALVECGITARFYLTQNDGTVVLADVAAANPVYSFASGPTNSMRGAAFLTGRLDGMVVDVGGTTADIGYLQGGFPRQANNVVKVGGVRTLFRMPDLLPIALGGGTIINPETLAIGPRSVGYNLLRDAMVFGGSILTATDIAVAAGLAEIGDRDRVKGLDKALVDGALAGMRKLLEENVDRMKTSAEGTPLLAVGGGAFLIPDELRGCSEVVRVEHAGVANAIGAAMAQVSGEVDQVFSGLDRDAALAEAERLARAQAVAAGAGEETISVIDAEDIPIAYLPGKARRVRLRVVGDIDFGGK